MAQVILVAKREISSIIDSKHVKKIERELNELVRRLGLPLEVVYDPDPDARDYAVLIGDKIIIYTVDENQIKKSLFHEIGEYLFKQPWKNYTYVVYTLFKIIMDILEKQKEYSMDRFAEVLLKAMEIMGKEDHD